MSATRPMPAGAPRWLDLTTSDIELSTAFYTGLFGWEAEVQSAEYGGYVVFRKNGRQVAGAMSRMPEDPSPDGWNVYLKSDDIAATVDAITANGGSIVVAPMQVGELGHMAYAIDPAGAVFGIWQTIQHPGFELEQEAGAPGWFELHSTGYAAATAFYDAVFGTKRQIMGDTDEFRYSVVVDDTGEQFSGAMDASAWGIPQSYWTLYISVDDTDAKLSDAQELGASIVDAAENTPYGRLATIADVTGARIKLIGPNTAD